MDQATPIPPRPTELGDHGRIYLLGGAVFIVLALLARLPWRRRFVRAS